MKWLWKRSTPSDWVWAKHLYSQSAICRCLPFSTQHWETQRAILLCVDLNPTDWACLCVWVCARTCVCLYLSAYARGCVWREGMLAYLRKSLSICVPATTHTTNLYRRGKRQQTCTLVILMSVCFSKTGDFICLYKEKKNMVNKKQMFKRRTTFTPLFLCPLCWAVMWLLYSISFLDIFYALNVVSLWRLDAHWKIFFGNSQREQKCTFFFDHDSLSLVNSFFSLQITCWFPFAKLKVRLNYTRNSVIGLKRKYVSMVVSFL